MSQDSNIGKVFLMDIDDYNILVNLTKELMQSWDGLTMGEAFEKRRSIGKKQLYRLRGTIMNMEDLGL